ncbi:helix-turn-helix domain-containing protein [Acetobacter persici]|nr:helix-turn-helix domain-containing protein [Acetobacter persici]
MKRNERKEDFMPASFTPSNPVAESIQNLGLNIRQARIRRSISMQSLSEMANTSRSTIQKVEQGDTGVSMGIYASVLHALGLLGNIREAAALANDLEGQQLALESLPKRVSSKRGSRTMRKTSRY